MIAAANKTIFSWQILLFFNLFIIGKLLFQGSADESVSPENNALLLLLKYKKRVRIDCYMVSIQAALRIICALEQNLSKFSISL